MEKDSSVYIKHILDAIISIEEYIAEMSFAAFEDDDLTNNAVARLFTVIGEAAARLPKNYKQSKPQIPWPQIAGLRNIIVHDYFDLKLDVMWKIIQKDLPVLKRELLTSLRNDFGENIDLPKS